MNILVISACSASKRHDDGVDGEALDRYSREELIDRKQDPSRVLPAREMYEGEGHRCVADAVDRLRTIADVDVDWRIISAGFGTLDSEAPIVPYDCTFSKQALNKSDYRTRADRLAVEDRGQTIDELIQDIGQAMCISRDILASDFTEYDLIFAMLGREYLLASTKVFENAPPSANAYLFAPDSMDDLTGSFTRIPANETERMAIGAIPIRQKEMQFQTLVSHIDSAADLRSLATDPQRIHELSITRKAAVDE